MTKPVNVMTYDMRDFLVSCVDKYCELAKVDPKFLKHVPTRYPFPRQPRGQASGQKKKETIASRELMKILFAAPMARWDLLRATQSLASGEPSGVAIVSPPCTGWSDTSTHHLTFGCRGSSDTP